MTKEDSIELRKVLASPAYFYNNYCRKPYQKEVTEEELLQMARDEALIRKKETDESIRNND